MQLVVAPHLQRFRQDLQAVGGPVLGQQQGLRLVRAQHTRQLFICENEDEAAKLAAVEASGSRASASRGSSLAAGKQKRVDINGTCSPKARSSAASTRQATTYLCMCSPS